MEDAGPRVAVTKLVPPTAPRTLVPRSGTFQRSIGWPTTTR